MVLNHTIAATVYVLSAQYEKVLSDVFLEIESNGKLWTVFCFMPVSHVSVCLFLLSNGYIILF